MSKEKCDNLFTWFEENKFENEGYYPRDTNLVFSFMDYLDNADNEEEIAEKLELTYDEETESYVGLDQAKEEMKKGCTAWINS